MSCATNIYICKRVGVCRLNWVIQSGVHHKCSCCQNSNTTLDQHWSNQFIRYNCCATIGSVDKVMSVQWTRKQWGPNICLVSIWVTWMSRYWEKTVWLTGVWGKPPWVGTQAVSRLGSQRESILMHLSTIRFSFYAMVLLNLCI